MTSDMTRSSRNRVKRECLLYTSLSISFDIFFFSPIGCPTSKISVFFPSLLSPASAPYRSDSAFFVSVHVKLYFPSPLTSLFSIRNYFGKDLHSLFFLHPQPRTLASRILITPCFYVKDIVVFIFSSTDERLTLVEYRLMWR